MNTTALKTPPRMSRPPLLLVEKRPEIPQLQSGDELDADEFLRRYLETSEDFKAELIDGVVYLMLSWVGAEYHGEPDNLMQTWIGNYSIATPGVKGATNSTAKLTVKDVPQPDALLRLLPERGGKTFFEKKYLCGVPELVVEISASSVSIDARKKRDAYRRAGVKEYINWLTEEGVLNWWYLKDGDYAMLPADADGIIRSRVFPGLWLDVKALLKDDGAKVMRVLRRGLRSAEHRAFVKG